MRVSQRMSQRAKWELCLCVCVCVCVCARVCSHTRVTLHVLVCICACICDYVHMCVCVCACARLRVSCARVCVCVFIYIYMLWSYYLVQVWGFWKLLSGPSLFFLKHRLSKNTIKIGVSAHFVWRKNCALKIWKLLSGPSWRFLRRTQLGPDNNFQLGPDNNFQNCHFFVNVCFEKCAKMPIL